MTPLKLNQLDGIWFATATGATSPQALREWADVLANLAPGPSGEPQLVAIDCGAMTGSLEMPDVFEVGCYFAATLRGKARVAIYQIPTSWVNQRFGEDVVVNRGLNLKIFADKAFAVAWLLGSK